MLNLKHIPTIKFGIPPPKTVTFNSMVTHFDSFFPNVNSTRAVYGYRSFSMKLDCSLQAKSQDFPNKVAE